MFSRMKKKVIDEIKQEATANLLKERDRSVSSGLRACFYGNERHWWNTPSGNHGSWIQCCQVSAMFCCYHTHDSLHARLIRNWTNYVCPRMTTPLSLVVLFLADRIWIFRHIPTNEIERNHTELPWVSMQHKIRSTAAIQVTAWKKIVFNIFANKQRETMLFSSKHDFAKLAKICIRVRKLSWKVTQYYTVVTVLAVEAFIV